MKGPQGERLHCGRCETIQRGCNGGFECWIGRIVVERTTVSRVEGSPMLAKKWCVAKWHSRPRPECWLDYTPLPQCNVEDHKNQNDEEADIKRSYYSLRCHNVPQSKRRSPSASPGSRALKSHLRVIAYYRFRRINAIEARVSPDSIGISAFASTKQVRRGRTFRVWPARGADDRQRCSSRWSHTDRMRLPSKLGPFIHHVWSGSARANHKVDPSV